jgi:glycosyltransferase involved in cell wall biosynthesis
MRRHLLSWLMNRFDEVVSISRFMQAREAQWFKVARPRRSIVYAGIAVPERPVALRANAARLVAVSNFAWQAKTEGVALLVRSMEEVRRRFPEAHLDIIGDGPYRHLVESAIQDSGTAGVVRLLGAIPSSRVREEMLSADAFVHVSFQDALPLVILEAMSIGLPIVATPVGGIGEILKAERNSVLVELACPAVADGISRVLADSSLRRRLQEQCLQDVERFTWDATGAAYDGIYENLLSAGNG